MKKSKSKQSATQALEAAKPARHSRRSKALAVTGEPAAKSEAITALPVHANATEQSVREAVIATALAMSRSGLSPGRSGNVSCRWIDAEAGPGMLITPSGVAYDLIQPADVVFVADDGSVPEGQPKPSSEWRFHLSAYHARPDRHAIVHSHSMNAVVLACAGRSIPAFHYMVAIAGTTEIPCVPYATFGTGKLARHVARGLAKSDACLMANHGQIAIATTLPAALELAHEVEILAEQYAKVLMLGRPVLLNGKAMREVLARFKSYGQHAQASIANSGKPKSKAKGKAAIKAKQKEKSDKAARGNSARSK